jgi:hypothetical protein
MELPQWWLAELRPEHIQKKSRPPPEGTGGSHFNYPILN